MFSRDIVMVKLGSQVLPPPTCVTYNIQRCKLRLDTPHDLRKSFNQMQVNHSIIVESQLLGETELDIKMHLVSQIQTSIFGFRHTASCHKNHLGRYLAERCNFQSLHLITIFTHFKTNTKYIVIYTVLRCCMHSKNQNLVCQ